jgi:threonine/homoserine/homoserine lactone efflux protein
LPINPSFFKILSIIGALYLLYLGYRIVFSDYTKEKEVSKPITFVEAMLFQWVNPKAWIMALGIITTYLTPNNFYLQLIFIVFIFFVTGLISSITWTLFGKIIKDRINAKLANAILGTLLMISVIQILFEKF